MTVVDDCTRECPAIEVDTSLGGLRGEAGMRKAGTGTPEQGTQAPSPALDLISAETENQPGIYIESGTVNGGHIRSGDQVRT